MFILVKTLKPTSFLNINAIIESFKSYLFVISLKLTLNIKVNNDDNFKISNFEKILDEMDLIYDFFISKFDKNYTQYQIIFNGTPAIFLKKMSDKNQNFDTQNKNWILQ